MSTTFAALSYKELQAESKKLGLKANGKKDALIAALEAAAAAADAENAPATNTTAPEAPTAAAAAKEEAVVVLNNGAQTPPAPPAATEEEEQQVQQEEATAVAEKQEATAEVVEEEAAAAVVATVPEPTIAEIAEKLAAEEFDTAASAGELVAEADGAEAAAEAAIEAQLVAAVDAIEITSADEAAADAARVAALVAQYPCLSFTEAGKVHCSLTGHDMKACPATVADYLAGKARTAALEARDCAALMAEYGEFLEEHDECFFVPLTGACLKKVRVAVIDHLTASAFLAAKEAWEAEDLEDEAVESEDVAGAAGGKLKGVKTPKGKHKFFESPAASKTPSGKAAWEKQIGSIAWQTAVDETVAPCKTPSH